VTVEIVEVIRRSEKGVTEPFICRGADDALYFVKGRAAGPLSLIREFVSGCLAKALGLPIAEFEIVFVADELIDPSSEMQLADLGTGLAFGSRQREYTTDIVFSQIKHIPADLRRDIMVFDRWIRNYDRSLSDQGGNPNLLWASDTNRVVMIDHNDSFNGPMEGHVFAERHIFGAEYLPLCHDRAGIAAYRERLDRSIEHWPDVVSSLPPEWLFMDAMETVPVNFNFNDSLAVLCEHRNEGFWSW
jgi:hypothetical protein